MAIKKKEISLDTIKGKFSTKTKYKPDSFYNCGEAFTDACGLPGPSKGHINMFLGHSNSSKTTAMILAAADAQKQGDLPVFIITERKWNWEHAVELGLQAEQNADGEWDGHFIFNDSFDYIEQATGFINDILDAQDKGEIPFNILFLWDSVGSIPCKMTFDGKGGKQHNAATFADKIGMGINQRISGSRKSDAKHENTLIVVNQPWVELPDNPFGQPKIKAKGGEAIWLNSSLVFLFGNQKGAGTNKITATKDKRSVKFAIRTKVGIHKNHMNGLGYADNKILATTHGFIEDDKKEIDKYKSDNKDYWAEVFGGVFDDTSFDVVEDNVIEAPVDYSDD